MLGNIPFVQRDFELVIIVIIATWTYINRMLGNSKSLQIRRWSYPHRKFGSAYV